MSYISGAALIIACLFLLFQFAKALDVDWVETSVLMFIVVALAGVGAMGWAIYNAVGGNNGTSVSVSVSESNGYDKAGKPMTAALCNTIYLGEPEKKVHEIFGTSPNGAGPTNQYTVWISYPYDSDYYQIGQANTIPECDVFYGVHHHVVDVYRELLP